MKEGNGINLKSRAGRIRLIFEQQWIKEGLPDFHPFRNAYVEARERVAFDEVLPENIDLDRTAFNKQQLRSVYGFGWVVAEMLQSWCGFLNDATALAQRDWCGRFNLAISLFDHLCDDLQLSERVGRLRVFAPIQPGVETFSPESETEMLLAHLVAGILESVALTGSQENSTVPAGDFSTLFQEMLEAECRLAAKKNWIAMEEGEIKKYLYTKSVGPFAAMGRYLIYRHHTVDLEFSSNCLHAAEAIGRLYMLVDDAEDWYQDRCKNDWNWYMLQKDISLPPLYEDLPAEFIEMEMAKACRHLKNWIDGQPEFNTQQWAHIGWLGASCWLWCFD